MGQTAENVEELNPREEERGIGDNSNLKEGSLEYFVEMIRIKAAREILNADADLARHKATDRGLNTKGLDAELREFQARNDEKEGWRQSREVGGEVLKGAKQADLFEILEDAKKERKSKRLALKKAAKEGRDNAAKS